MIKKVQQMLFELEDLGYKEFHSHLMPTVDPDTVIGVRTPELRRLAGKLAKDPEINLFLDTLPHTYYEENNLHGFILERIKDYEACVEAVDIFLPYIDNWATCDMFTPKVFKKHLPELLEKIREWMSSEKTYTVRFGIKMLMNYYLDEAFSPVYLEMVAGVKSDEYYINMMIAWFFATALAKQYEDTVPYLEEKRLERWIHNKTIQKAVESRRIEEQKKIFLKTLKEK
ncbi:MAG: DNA alkylation repair protein [Eubacterium sp.]|nr:DNA alkylation repair protein [Eubacterium sp.]